MLYVVISIFVVLLLTVIILYNTLIRKKNDIENAFASIDAMLKKRYDQIPALVETIKGYMMHERNLLTEITALRTKALLENSGSLCNRSPVSDYSFIENNLRFLTLLTEIVEDLNLNTRIWTKE